MHHARYWTRSISSIDGIWGACVSFDLQKKIDWDQRKSDLLKIIKNKELDKINGLCC